MGTGCVQDGLIRMPDSWRRMLRQRPLHAGQRQGAVQVDAPEAALVEGVDVIPVVDSLVSLVAHLRGVVPIEPYELDMPFGGNEELPYVTDLKHIKGQEYVKRALKVEAAGLALRGSRSASWLRRRLSPTDHRNRRDNEVCSSHPTDLVSDGFSRYLLLSPALFLSVDALGPLGSLIPLNPLRLLIF